MKTINIELYNINELKTVNEKAYKKLIDEAKEFLINDRFYFADEDITNILKDKYNLLVDKKNIEYSISYCQGDGVCFTMKNILSYTRIKNNDNLNAFEKWIIDNLNNEEKALLLEYLNSGYNLNIIKTSYHYSPARTCTIDYEYFYSSDDPIYIDRINNFIDELCKKLFDEAYIAICEYIEGVLYDYYEIEESECVEFLTENNYLYDRHGIQYE